MGRTRVICSAMLEDGVPPFLKGSGSGWLTAEYGMLPASSGQRIGRERNKVGGRTHEIQRLIGRSLRNCVDLKQLGERSLIVDCDVMDADGGTRTASITGGFIAVALALRELSRKIHGIETALKLRVAAVSVGIVRSEFLLDLNYAEDKDAEVDMNIVKVSDGRFVEVQGTSESNPFPSTALDRLVSLANKGIEELFAIQRSVLEG